MDLIEFYKPIPSFYASYESATENMLAGSLVSQYIIQKVWVVHYVLKT